MANDTDERVKLSTEDALAMLPDGDTVHVFKNPAGILVGADWDRADVVKLISDAGAELAGPAADSMGHGLVARDGTSWAFIETKPQWRDGE